LIDLKSRKTPPERLPFDAGTKEGVYSEEAYEKDLLAVMTPIEKRLWDNYKNAPSELLVKLSIVCEDLDTDNHVLKKENLKKILSDHQRDLDRMDMFQHDFITNFAKAFAIGNRSQINRELYALMQEYSIPEWDFL